ncbi:sugar ABC transporter ATP-binding protein [Candidatus Aerophobetes bacterium]|nr:sugar ABC transporter ATP-binding protein [Candidatus Aerophobetes bacterium]
MGKLPLVKLVNIHKWFGRVSALEGVDLSADYNEIVGLVGDNGAGKSTLIKILSGVYSPDKGEIRWEGKKINFSSPKDAIKLGIETIHQEAALVDKMNIMRNIFIGREPVIRFGPIGWLNMKKMASESMRALEGVALYLRSPQALVEELSGGQRQGVAIARAMYFKTKLLVLDEPTNNLSVKESKRILRSVTELKEQGISSIFITHNLYHVYPIADRIVVLSHGKKVGEFKKEETSIDDLTELITLK